jgi:hypothetical protein
MASAFNTLHTDIETLRLGGQVRPLSRKPDRSISEMKGGAPFSNCDERHHGVSEPSSTIISLSF